MKILDTSALIELLNGSSQGASIRKLCTDSNIAISTITVNEFLIGEYYPWQEEFLSQLIIIPFDEYIAKNTATLEKKLIKAGKTMGKLDAFIAGTAITNNAELLTLDKDFTKVPGLKVTVI